MSIVNITFPDGAIKSFQSGISAMEIAKQLSNSLAKKIIS